MYHQKKSPFRHAVAAAVFALLLSAGHYGAAGQTAPGIDFFTGLDFNFRDFNYHRQYDLLIRLTPGFKWDMGKHWQVAGQVMVPVFNQYGDSYKYVRVNVLDVSKELKVWNLCLKASAGVFTNQRYGVDLKAFLPLTRWLALEGEAGLTGILTMNPNWWISPMDRFSWTAGGDIYLSRWNTQLRGVVGHYLYRDFGCEAEAMRHFNHTTVSVYGRWNNVDRFDGGFRVVVALPPYRRTRRVVNFRPASNFRLSYSVMYHEYTNRMYKTDPEENERDGWFSRDVLDWGSHTMTPDFIYNDNVIDQPE